MSFDHYELASESEVKFPISHVKFTDAINENLMKAK